MYRADGRDSRQREMVCVWPEAQRPQQRLRGGQVVPQVTEEYAVGPTVGAWTGVGYYKAVQA